MELLLALAMFHLLFIFARGIFACIFLGIIWIGEQIFKVGKFIFMKSKGNNYEPIN